MTEKQIRKALHGLDERINKVAGNYQKKRRLIYHGDPSLKTAHRVKKSILSDTDYPSLLNNKTNQY